MAENRVETMPANGTPATAAPAPAPAAPAATGGLGAWLPLIAALVLMPAVAYLTTQFLLVPKLEKAVGAAPAAAAAEAPAKARPVDANGKIEPGKPKFTYSLNKVLVNVSGSIGTRYLIANYTLVGSTPDFKVKIEEDRDQLLDLASSVMGTKTISDLEKPGARNLIRNELMAAFNNALGGSVVKEIYITEFAIQ